jgi:hypothetical protein
VAALVRAGVVGLGLALAVGPAGAETVRVPLTVDYDMLARVIALRLGARPEAAAGGEQLGEGCVSLRVEDVVARASRGRVEIRAAGRGRIGLPVFRWCFLPIGMEGELRIRGTPSIGPDWRLRLRDVETVVVTREGKSTFVTRRLTGAAAPRVREAVEGLAIDLGPPVDQARSLIHDVLDESDRAAALAIVASVRPGEVEAAKDGIRVTVLMDVPPPRPEPVGPPAPLGPAEAARWREALDRWDAFVVFVVKRLGVDQADDEVVRSLFEIFLAARYDLAAAVEETPVEGEDPVRRLFRRSWGALREVVRRVAKDGPPDQRVLRYVAFLTAGDALAALDRIGPSLGVEVSADGLRRLARTIDPTALDPLIGTGDRVDPELQRLLGFHEPDVPPPPSEQAEPSGQGPPAGSVPPAGAAPQSWLWPFVGVARAAESGTAATLRGLAPRLDRWVPDPHHPAEVDRYRELISRLLDATVGAEASASDVPSSAHALYRRLVRTAAWQESCWRHFLRDGGRVSVLRSASGDIGLMQVNRYVWRGVFDERRLEWDILYNAGAGSEILARLLVRYGLAEAKKPGGHAARSAYSAYQGGPRAHRRYRTGAHATAYTRGIDRAFWRKYQVTERGEELRHVPCGPFDV